MSDPIEEMREASIRELQKFYAPFNLFQCYLGSDRTREVIRVAAGDIPQRVYASVYEAADDVRRSVSMIRKACTYGLACAGSKWRWADGKVINRMGPRHTRVWRMATATEGPVLFESVASAARATGVKHGAIWQACHRQIRAGGYFWALD